MFLIKLWPTNFFYKSRSLSTSLCMYNKFAIIEVTSRRYKQRNNIYRSSFNGHEIHLGNEGDQQVDDQQVDVLLWFQVNKK